MTSKALWWAAGILAAAAIAVVCAALVQNPSAAAAQDLPTVHFSGVISDYPVSTTSSGATTGPWEVSGPWSLNLQGQSGTANFSAALTMEFSDLSAGAGAATNARHQHTHHITMNGGVVIQNPPQGTSPGDCPSNAAGTHPYTSRLEVTGMADVAGNGGSPFGAGVLVPVQVCIDGSIDVQFSNITLVFTNLSDGSPSPATLHFGSQPVHGVVSGTN